MKQAWQKDFSALLKKHFLQLQEKNAKFSARAFAKKIGLSPAAVSGLLGNKNWNITAERAAAVLVKLQVPEIARNRMLVKMGLEPVHERAKLSEKNYDILTDWTYYPILFSYDLPEDLAAAESIARRLKISEKKVLEVTDDLIRRGLLERTASGKVQRPRVFLETSDRVPSEYIRKFHEMNLELSRRALAETPFDKQDFTSLTFVASEGELDALRKEIRKLYERASSLEGDELAADNVFRLSVQLFPLEFLK